MTDLLDKILGGRTPEERLAKQEAGAIKSLRSRVGGGPVFAAIFDEGITPQQILARARTLYDGEYEKAGCASDPLKTTRYMPEGRDAITAKRDFDANHEALVETAKVDRITFCRDMHRLYSNEGKGKEVDAYRDAINQLRAEVGKTTPQDPRRGGGRTL